MNTNDDMVCGIEVEVMSRLHRVIAIDIKTSNDDSYLRQGIAYASLWLYRKWIVKEGDLLTAELDGDGAACFVAAMCNRGVLDLCI